MLMMYVIKKNLNTDIFLVENIRVTSYLMVLIMLLYHDFCRL